MVRDQLILNLGTIDFKACFVAFSNPKNNEILN